MNCSGLPLVTNQNDLLTFIIDHLALSSLHLALSAFNKLWNDLEEIAPEINKVAEDLGTVREDYRGRLFEGNETNKLLENTSKIRAVIDDELQIFVNCMDSLYELKLACSGYSLQEDYKEKIKVFKDDWTQLHIEYGVKITNKVHIIFAHLEDFIDRQKRPLGEFSEQVVEAAHQKLDKIWQWYLVKMVESEVHGDQFLKCVNHFNSMNI